MAREIKFRYTWERPKSGAGPYRPDDAKVKITHLSLEDIEQGKSIKPQGYPNYNYSHLVARDEYTGLKDSQLVEEYFGDIVIAIFDDVWDLFIIEDGASAVLFRSPTTDNVYYFWDMPEGYVIGNIYENPEL